METAEQIADALQLCPNLKEFSMKKCKLTADMFKKLVSGVQPTHQKLEFCSNNLSNAALASLRDHFLGNLLNTTQLQHLSLQNCDLEGKEACTLIAALNQLVPRLQSLNIAGNMIYPNDLIELKGRIDTDVKNQKLKIE
jgi:Ran GTPase-activating protein (RanGAP) involved in mRNA processing and transport